ncbi:MAG TPA: heme exporter protein CcmB [Ferruginibacter sp.]|nr:heme exporter protein CcmB [Ferruginibacter sp.]MBN8699688.1 heme exporter protein CcmB [Chitinophagales bacterium]HMX36536.1 heme exporter protein CcmB [Ferruginibacter sp.]HNF02642.1 heme exporter protein CcmB [Ferruginibacter sp.]HNK29975.1 heme exporter protein CcmB [Ferruginibacter sp.]
MKRVFALLGKDILLEFRQKHTFYGILLYIASTIFVLYLSLDKTDAAVWNGLFWVIQLFICVNAVAKSFLQESRGRMLYFYSIASPVEFILAKLLYNLLLMVLMSLISLALFATFLDNPVSNMLLFTGIVVLGGMGISIVFTLMSAIAAKAQQNAALIAILGFPVILPQLMLLMRLSKTAFAEVFKEGALLQMTGLIAGLDVLVIGLALILFPYLWKE